MDYFPIQLEISSSQLTSYFSQGLKPPTSIYTVYIYIFNSPLNQPIFCFSHSSENVEISETMTPVSLGASKRESGVAGSW